MHNISPREMLLLLSVFAGAIHVLALDHWVPASVLAWQKGWRASRSAAFATAIYLVHLLLGFLIYFALDEIGGRAHLPETQVFWLALSIVGILVLVRAARFPRISEVLRAGPKSRWGMISAMGLLGPCEFVVPVFVKAKQLGMGYLTPFSAFLAGTLMTGLVVVVLGRFAWHQPHWLSRSMLFARKRKTLLPVALGLAAGLIVLSSF